MYDTIYSILTQFEFEEQYYPFNIATNLLLKFLIMFQQYGGLFSQAEKELALKRITNSRLHHVAPVQSMGKPVVVPIASKGRVINRFERRVNIRFERRVIIRFARRVIIRFERRVIISIRFERRVKTIHFVASSPAREMESIPRGELTTFESILCYMW